MMNFASSSSQIRSDQKDFRIIEYLKNATDDFLTSIPTNGTSFVHSLKAEIELMVKSSYLILTKLGNGTFGEQYCNLIEVTQGDLGKPSTIRIIVLVILSLVPNYLSKKLRSLNLELKDRSLKSISFQLLDPLIKCFKLLHTVFFLKNGKFMHFSKRILGLKYIDASLKNSSDNKYQFLIVLLLLQFFVTIGKTIDRFLIKDLELGYVSKPQSNSLEICRLQSLKESKKAGTNFRCQLCLDFCKLPTATPCGHIFCWGCISKWNQLNKTCSTCRLELSPQELIFLRHYDQKT